MELPEFKSPFLKNVSRRLRARRKALKHHGELTWETKQPDDFEWLSVYFTPHLGNYCVFQFVEDNRVCVYVRSKKRIDRGRILLRIEDITVVSNAHAIIDAVEATIDQSFNLGAGNGAKAADVIRAAWSRVELRVADDPD